LEGRMAEPFLNVLRMGSPVDQETGAGMAQVVRPEPWRPCEKASALGRGSEVSPVPCLA
jgi:hypothetical protein